MALTACASWREPPTTLRLGWVKEIIDGAAIQNPAERPCVAPLTAQALAAQRWVVVSVPHGRYRRWYTVALPDGFTVKPGDRVLIDPADCDVAIRHSD